MEASMWISTSGTASRHSLGSRRYRGNTEMRFSTRSLRSTAPTDSATRCTTPSGVPLNDHARSGTSQSSICQSISRPANICACAMICCAVAGPALTQFSGYW